MAEEQDMPQRYPKRVRKPVKKELPTNTVRNPKRWSPKEKDLLNSALRKYGDQDLALLSAKVGTKTPAHIYSYLSTHKQAAFELMKKHERTARLDRLNGWVEHIRSKKQKNPSPNPVALSMLMIALMEDHPVPTDGEVSFTEAYNYMFELLSGRHTERWKEGALSEPTLQFVKLSTLKLMKAAIKRMNRFQTSFLNSATTPDLFTGSLNMDHLPGPVRRLVLHKHLNPLRLNAQSTETGALLGTQADLSDSSQSETISSQTIMTPASENPPTSNMNTDPE